MNFKILFAMILGIGTVGFAHTMSGNRNFVSKPVLADAVLLKHIGAPILYQDPQMKVAYSSLTPELEQRLSQVAHSIGRCGGYESLETSNPDLNRIRTELQMLKVADTRSAQYGGSRIRQYRFAPNPTVQTAVGQLSADNLKSWVTWMSAFPSRFEGQKDPNIHVRALVERLQTMSRSAGYPVVIDTIDHRATKQKSIRLHIQGSQRAKEVVVLGAHFDSISPGSVAPGADDNASGSSNLLEILRVLLTQPQPQRSIEFFWYAGEEAGLLGSAEIAKAYKATQVNVISVLQLDMTLHPGLGRGTFAFMTDYTSPWLRDILLAINNVYVGAKAVEDQCGYGCSDHASWHRNGFPAAIPFEANMRTMNNNIHTVRDVINTKSDFEHSLLFSKIGLAYAMEMANSTQRQPFSLR